MLGARSSGASGSLGCDDVLTTTSSPAKQAPLISACMSPPHVENIARGVQARRVFQGGVLVVDHQAAPGLADPAGAEQVSSAGGDCQAGMEHIFRRPLTARDQRIAAGGFLDFELVVACRAMYQAGPAVRQAELHERVPVGLGVVEAPVHLAHSRLSAFSSKPLVPAVCSSATRSPAGDITAASNPGP